MIRSKVTIFRNVWSQIFIYCFLNKNDKFDKKEARYDFLDVKLLIAILRKGLLKVLIK
jgi:hypothetical protein